MGQNLLSYFSKAGFRETLLFCQNLKAANIISNFKIVLAAF